MTPPQVELYAGAVEFAHELGDTVFCKTVTISSHRSRHRSIPLAGLGLPRNGSSTLL